MRPRISKGTLQGNGLTKLANITTAIPEIYAMRENYPNPFNPTTTIQFDLPQAGEVTLKINNSVGQSVRTLASGKYEPGAHRIVWDATNDAGLRVASGMYLFAIEVRDTANGGARSFAARRKLTLLK